MGWDVVGRPRSNDSPPKAVATFHAEPIDGSNIFHRFGYKRQSETQQNIYCLVSVSVLARIDNLENQFVSPNSSEFHFLAVDCLLLNQA
jgi:hypothetical protein